MDATSCHALRAHSMAISTAGVCPSPAWLPDVLAEGRAVLCGFDADDPGDDAARVMTARHPAVGRLRPSEHDWNDQLRARSADPARS